MQILKLGFTVFVISILVSTLNVNSQIFAEEDEKTCEERYDIWKRVGTEEFYKIFSSNADMRYCVSLYESGYYEGGQTGKIQNYLTFVDPAGKFKIQYPPDWTKEHPQDLLTKVRFESPDTSSFSNYIDVLYTPLNFEATLVDFADESHGLLIPGFRVVSDDDTTVSGLAAKKVVYSGHPNSGGVQVMMIFVIQNTDGYILVYTTSPQNFASNLPNALKIFQTFELGDFSGEIPQIKPKTLVEETQSIDIPDWIRNNAKWWSEGGIEDKDFASGIEFLIKEDIMKIPKIKQDLNSTNVSKTEFGGLRIYPNEYYIGEDQKINVKIMGDYHDSTSDFVEIYLIDPRGFKDKFSTYTEGPNGEFSFVLPFDHFSLKGEYLVKGTSMIENIGSVTFYLKDTSEKPIAEEKTIPPWVKNNADWWSQGLITDDDFVKGIQYLVEQGIIEV